MNSFVDFRRNGFVIGCIYGIIGPKNPEQTTAFEAAEAEDSIFFQEEQEGVSVVVPRDKKRGVTDKTGK